MTVWLSDVEYESLTAAHELGHQSIPAELTAAAGCAAAQCTGAEFIAADERAASKFTVAASKFTVYEQTPGGSPGSITMTVDGQTY